MYFVNTLTLQNKYIITFTFVNCHEMHVAAILVLVLLSVIKFLSLKIVKEN